MSEISQHQALDQKVLSDPNQVANVDLVCYVYDSSDPNSFSYLASLRVGGAVLFLFCSKNILF